MSLSNSVTGDSGTVGSTPCLTVASSTVASSFWALFLISAGASSRFRTADSVLDVSLRSILELLSV